MLREGLRGQDRPSDPALRVVTRWESSVQCWSRFPRRECPQRNALPPRNESSLPLPTPHPLTGGAPQGGIPPDVSIPQGQARGERGESLESGYWEEALEPCGLPSKYPVLRGQWAQGGLPGGPGKV